MKIANGILTEYDGTDSAVVIPKGVTEVGERAFYRAPVTSLKFEEGVKVIGQSAFSPCSNLKDITLPESLEELGEFAFSCCASLEEIALPKGLSTIHRSAFSMCKRLKHIELPEGLEELNESVFLGCSGLKKAFIPRGVRFVHNRAFADCTSLLRITVDSDNPYYKDLDGVLYSRDGKTLVIFPGGLLEVSIPDFVEEIGPGAFYYNLNFDRIRLPASLKRIGEGAFYRCCELTGMDLPETLEELEGSVFEGCSKLGHLTIPANVKRIGESSFRKCPALMWLELPENLPFDVHWFTVHNDPPAFSADHTQIPFISTRPIEDITSRLGLRRAVLGFILAEIDGVKIKEDIRRGYADYIRNHPSELEDDFMNNDDVLKWMCDNCMIPYGDIEYLLEKASEEGHASASALLLDYQGRIIDPAGKITAGGQIEKRFEALENAFDF